MKEIIITGYFIVTVLFAFSQAEEQKTDFNFGFENITPGQKLPDHWFQWGQGYKLAIDTVEKYSGNVSIRIEPVGETSSSLFGCVATSIPANYEGKQIEVKAFMKWKDVSREPIGLLLRIDGSAGMLEFDNMQKKKIMGTSGWTQFSVKLKYPENAKLIYLGALLSGTGQLWVDDFQLLIDGNDFSKAKLRKPVVFKADNDHEFDNGSKILFIPLTDSKIKDLDILGKVWGFLKYYHPAVAKGNYNWDYELFRILPTILNSQSTAERNNILSAWVDSLGEVASAKPHSEKKKEIKLLPDLSFIDSSSLGGKLLAQLTNIINAKRKEDHYYVDLFPGVGNAIFDHENPYSTMKYPDAGFRLLCLYRYWNIIQYYFPYKNLIGENWNDVLKEFVPKFINASNELEYKLTTLSLIARVHDTHANIWMVDSTLKRYWGFNYPPFEVSFIEGKAVVMDYYDDTLGKKSGIKRGDIIEAINSKPVDEFIRERLPLTPASNYPTQLRDIAYNILRTNDTLLLIGCKRGDSLFTAEISCYGPEKINIYSRYERKDTCFKIINNDIAYHYPGTVQSEHFPKIIPDLLKTKGLIIDFRCYPSDFILYSLCEYLFPQPTSFFKCSYGSAITPGLFVMTDEIKAGKKNKKFYKGKVVIIVNEQTQSSAEFHVMAYRIAPGAIVIGSTTAAADGNVSDFKLPGGISTMISGIGIYYPDGRETQRVGIVPDIEVKPTIKGIRENRDELLEKAVEIINQK